MHIVLCSHRADAVVMMTGPPYWTARSVVCTCLARDQGSGGISGCYDLLLLCPSSSPTVFGPKVFLLFPSALLWELPFSGPVPPPKLRTPCYLALYGQPESHQWPLSEA